MNRSFKKTVKLTLCAALSGLSFIALYLGTIAGVFDLCAVVVGALCMAFAVIEFGGVWPWLVCAVASVLSFVLLPDKMVALEYIFLGGAYPILKCYFERGKKITSWILKLLYFNIALTAVLLVAKFVFPNDESWQILGPVTYIVGNAFFGFFDYAMTTFITFYLVKLRKRLKLKDMH